METQKTKTPRRVVALSSLLVAALTALPFTVQAAEPPQTELDTEAQVTFTAGVLELVSAPNLTFTSTALNSTGAYEIALSSADDDVVVSDMRGVDVGDWQLNVSLTSFSDGADTDSLLASVIEVAAATPVGPTDVEAEMAKCDAAIQVTSLGTPVEAKMMEAETGAGFGLWSITLDGTNTTLKVHANAQPKPTTHTAQMDWTLVDGV